MARNGASSRGALSRLHENLGPFISGGQRSLVGHVRWWTSSRRCQRKENLGNSARCRLRVTYYLSHTFSAFWLRSSVVSVLISVKTDMTPCGSHLFTEFLAGLPACVACDTLGKCRLCCSLTHQMANPFTLVMYSFADKKRSVATCLIPYWGLWDRSGKERRRNGISNRCALDGLSGIAALGSKRINLSPFTKGCREWGAYLRLTKFLEQLLSGG